MSLRAVSESEKQSLKEEAESVEQEARMVVPGIQAIFGFQMIAVFNQRFEELEFAERAGHMGALVLVALSIALILAPAAYHRLAEKGLVSRRFIDLASGFLAWAMASLALGIAIELYVAARLALDSPSAGWAVGLGMGLVLAWLWFLFPFRSRTKEQETKG
jgi:hypothetical protein